MTFSSFWCCFVISTKKMCFWRKLNVNLTHFIYLTANLCILKSMFFWPFYQKKTCTEHWWQSDDITIKLGLNITLHLAMKHKTRFPVWVKLIKKISSKLKEENSSNHSCFMSLHLLSVELMMWSHFWSFTNLLNDVDIRYSNNLGVLKPI